MTLHLDDFVPAFPISPLALVGVCASGKTTVSRLLADRGIAAKAVAQEHSRVPDLYKRSGIWVVVLAATWETVHRRRRLSWNPEFYRTEWNRLAMARRDAHLIVHTDWLTAEEVADRVTLWFDRQFGFAALWALSLGLNADEQALIRRQHGFGSV